jgi:hypothetical protein
VTEEPRAGGRDEFFVGYAATMPRGILSRVRLALFGIFLAGAGVALAGAILQRDPGRAEWAATSTVEGVFRARPYPRIVIDEGDAATTLLLVCEGKHAPGADFWCGPAPDGVGSPWVSADRVLDPDRLEGASVRATGRRIRRLDATHRGPAIFELAPATGGFEVISAATPVAPAQRETGGATVTLIGEIVDPKCFMGVMKPGDGRTHRACAWLCVRGGIPPVLVVDEPQGRRAVVLASADGGPANAQVLDFVGDTVEVTGMLSPLEGMEVLRITSPGPQRVP